MKKTSGMKAVIHKMILGNILYWNGYLKMQHGFARPGKNPGVGHVNYTRTVDIMSLMIASVTKNEF